MTEIPPTIRRLWMPTEDFLCLVIYNRKNKKGFTLKTNRVYVVFSQLLDKFVPTATDVDTREALRNLIECGVTVVDKFLFYLAYEEEYLPTDPPHEVSPYVVINPNYTPDNPISAAEAIIEVLELNTLQMPAQLVRPKASPVASTEGAHKKESGEPFSFN